MIQEIKGCYTALITPLKDDRIDYDKLEKLIADQIEAGVDGILACGTTGQSATLRVAEHCILAKRIYNFVQSIDPSVNVIVGAGSNSTHEAISLSRDIEREIGPTTFLQKDLLGQRRIEDGGQIYANAAR